jgi:D-alanyl-lipoteichoic acid acyltransferase DltB (MBOAT superfamily)
VSAIAGSIAPAGQRISAGFVSLRRHWLEMLMLPFAVWALALYQVEGGDALMKVMSLAVGGFVISALLPLALRLPFFVLLSAAGVFVVFGWIDGAWLLGVGLTLIGICHLAIPVWARALTMVAVGIALGFLRAGFAPVPWSGAVWPILASMFIFRVVLYLKSQAIKDEKNAPTPEQLQGPWSTLAYFFMLPNVVFPLFPVVDHQAFVRNRFDRPDTEIYQTGVQWIVRGVMHLVLYRIVYLTVLGDPADVQTLGDLAQYMLGTFALYLRVSGQFHLIVGLLYLFGFRLPETHKMYYLSHSFTELWRRINIFWTEFMMKAVFYPVYFKVKHLKPTTAMALSTSAVFLVTWVLHSYQWFWLRGETFLTLPDALFWTILGALVVYGGIRELKAPKKIQPRATGWSGRQAFKAVRTFVIFCTLWSLWSAESLNQWLWMLGAASEVDLKGVVLIGGMLGIIALLGGHAWNAKKPATAVESKWAVLASPRVRAIATLAVLILLAQPAISNLLPMTAAESLATVRSQQLSSKDVALKHRGYYEQLDGRNQLVAHEAAEDFARTNWQRLNDMGVVRETRDELVRDLIPSRNLDWNGQKFSTNRFGMRDREYPVEKPAGTLRIALLGPSHVMGNGVGDDDTFDNVLERRLQAEGRRVEILNFAVEGYSLPQEVAMLERRVRQFRPDVTLLTVFHPCTAMTEQYLLRAVYGDIPISDPQTHAILERAGLVNIDHGRVPIPYTQLRALAGKVGLTARMPQGEADWRVRRVGVAVTARAIERFAEVSRGMDAEPLALALDAVVDGGPTDVPYAAELAAARVPVIDLLGIYPPGKHAALRARPWDDHPNAEAHRLIADEIYRQILPVLERRTAGTAADAR